MKIEVRELVEDIFIKKNYKRFLKLCKTNLRELATYAEEYSKRENLKFGMYTCEDEPDPKINIDIEYCIDKKEYIIKAKSIIRISKLIKVFELNHAYEIKLKNKESLLSGAEKDILPRFGDFSDKPYTLKQKKLEEYISTYYQKIGYRRLWKEEGDEVILDLEYRYQLEVSAILFNDVFDIGGVKIDE
jgi:hypothetical protein